jgi:hypothetical protein
MGCITSSTSLSLKYVMPFTNLITDFDIYGSRGAVGSTLTHQTASEHISNLVQGEALWR